jgi:hypothetical protein
MNANVNIAQRTQQTALETETPSSFSTQHNINNHDHESNNNNNNNQKFAFSFAKKFDNAIPPISFISPPLLNQKQNEFNFSLCQSHHHHPPSQRHPLPPLILHKKVSKTKSIDSESSSSVTNTTTEMSSSESSLSSFGLAMIDNNNNNNNNINVNLLNDNHPNKRVKSSASSRSASLSMSHSSLKITTNKSPSQTQQNDPVAERFDRNQQNISIAIYDDDDDDDEKPKTITTTNKILNPSSHSIDSVRLDELKSSSSEHYEEYQRCTKSAGSSEYERIKENLNDFSRRVDFKMKGLLADDETRNQVNDWTRERGVNVPPPPLPPVVNIQYISSNKKNKTTSNTNSNSQSYYRTFNDWRSHLIFYKQTKGYHRNTPEEMSFRNLKNSNKETKSNEKSTLTSTNANDGEQSQQQQLNNKQHYPLAILNTNFSMGNKHLLTNDHYIDQLKQIQTRILQPDANLLPEVKKLGPFNKHTSNSESDLALLGPNNLHQKKPLAKLYGITATNTNNNNLNKDDLSLQVVNAFPKKIQPENNKQQSCNDLTAVSMEKMTSGSFTNTHANTNGSEKMCVPQMQPALNGTLIHLKNRAGTPHKAITNIGFKMEHKPLSSESNNQKTIPYTKGMNIFFDCILFYNYYIKKNSYRKPLQ